MESEFVMSPEVTTRCGLARRRRTITMGCGYEAVRLPHVISTHDYKMAAPVQPTGTVVPHGSCTERLRYDERTDNTITKKKHDFDQCSQGDSGFHDDENANISPENGNSAPCYCSSSNNLHTRSVISEKLRCLVPGKGQLNVSIYQNHGLVTVHVIEALRLHSRRDVLCDSYVRITLLPDDDQSPRCKTNTVRDSNAPNFDEKFSFELGSIDRHKRLLITIWNRARTTERREFLGSMSFGVKNLKSSAQGTHGWFYLLTEDTCRRKHLRAPEERVYTTAAFGH